MKNFILLLSLCFCFQLSCSAQQNATIGKIKKNGKVKLTINKKNFLAEWSKELASVVGNEIKTSLQNLRLVKQDNDEYILMANSADNTIKSAKNVRIVGKKIITGDRTCTGVGCAAGCSPEFTNERCICLNGCDDCEKTVTLEYQSK